MDSPATVAKWKAYVETNTTPLIVQHFHYGQVTFDDMAVAVSGNYWTGKYNSLMCLMKFATHSHDIHHLEIPSDMLDEPIDKDILDFRVNSDKKSKENLFY